MHYCFTFPETKFSFIQDLSSIFKLYALLFYLHLCKCLDVYLVSEEAEDDIGYPGMSVVDSCKSSCGCLEQSPVLCTCSKSQVLIF